MFNKKQLQNNKNNKKLKLLSERVSSTIVIFVVSTYTKKKQKMVNRHIGAD